jgi:hypothetical protein
MMEIIACALSIWGNTVAGLLMLIGNVLMLPGQALVIVGEWLADLLE